MRITSLKLSNVRAIEAAEFRFRPGFNLITGVNGAGKTSVLDALCVCLSVFLKRVNKLRVRAEAFALGDIRVGADALSLECAVEIDSTERRCLIHKPREMSAPQKKKVGMPREQSHDTPARTLFIGEPLKLSDGTETGGRPLAVLFSTSRAVPSDRAPRKSVAAGGTDAAFAGAFASRELRLSEFAAWMRAQQTLRSELSSAGQALASLEDAARRFLPKYRNLRVDSNGRQQLLIDCGKETVAVHQMSDGERGTLALVLDLTRRLFQANPGMHNPIEEAEAVVLIDEIELHLHPSWQRQIVRKLTTTFPRCQFIATTHSPQVIGEVQHDRIQIIDNGDVYSPTHSYGADSSRVLEEVMDAHPRTIEVQELLTKVSQEVGKQQYKKARDLLAQLVECLGENDPETTRVKTLLDFMEGEE